MPERFTGPILFAASDDVATDLLVLELGRRGVRPLRINLNEFPNLQTATWRPQEALWVLDQHEVEFSHASSIWFRRWPAADPASMDQSWAKVLGEERSTFLEGLADSLPQTWINRPEHAQYADNKLVQLARARALGMATPRTIVTNSTTDARAFLTDTPEALFKPLRVSFRQHENGAEFFYATPISPADLANYDLAASPALFQQIVAARREWRCTVVGDRVFPAEITWHPSRSVIDVHLADPTDLAIRPAQPPAEFLERCVALSADLGLTYCAIDAVEDTTGQIYFLELNPAGQWGWIERSAGLPITRAIVDLLLSSPASSHDKRTGISRG